MANPAGTEGALAIDRASNLLRETGIPAKVSTSVRIALMSKP
ncbi:hypothetical protein YK56LOC_32420 [Caballeronia sp. HLA56]